MKKQLFYIVFIWGMCLMYMGNICGQAQVDTIDLKKGEVFDLLLLSQNADTKDELQRYFQTATPVAKKMAYKPLFYLQIGASLQGNHRPDLLVFGKWANMSKRQYFLDTVIDEVPDFHEQRSTIWSYFGLRYFEIQEDVSIEMDRNKYLVATAYWLKSKTKSSPFYQTWKRNVQSSGGEILMDLQDGASPFGYRYDPDCFVITSWENEAAFQVFQHQMQDVNMDNIEHVNEFVLE